MRNKQNGAWSRLKNWALGPELPTEAKVYAATRNPAVSEWPVEHDDTPFDGVKVVCGTHCRTPAEYKAALVKNQIGLY